MCNPTNSPTSVRTSYKATKTKVNYLNLVYYLLSNLPFLLAFDPSSSEEEGTHVRACDSGKVLQLVLKFNESLMKCSCSPGYLQHH